MPIILCACFCDASLCEAGAGDRIVLARTGDAPIVVDLDGDGDNELIWHWKDPSGHLDAIFSGVLTRQGLRQTRQINLAPPAYVRYVGSWSPGRRAEIFVTRKDSSGCWIEAYGSGREPARKYPLVTGEDHDSIPGWQGSVEAAGILHSQRGGPLLVATLQTGFDRAPRGVVAYELDGTRTAWVDYTAAAVIECRIDDLDLDGTDEVVYTTSAVCNGHVRPGETDCESSVTILDHEGRRLARRVLGGTFSHAGLAGGDLTGGRELEVVVTLHPGSPGEASRLYVLDRELNVVAQLDLEARPDPPVLVDVDGDGKQEILVGDEQGSLILARVSGERLRVVRRRRFAEEIRPAAPLVFPPADTFLLPVCGKERLWLTDSRLRVRGTFDIAAGDAGAPGRPAAHPAVLPAGLGSGLVVWTPAAGIVLERVSAPMPRPWERRSVQAAVLAALALAAVGWLVGARCTRGSGRGRTPAAPAAPVRPANWVELVRAARNFDHGRDAVSALQALGRRLMDSKHSVARAALLAEARDAVANGVVQQVRSLCELASRSPATRPAAHEAGDRLQEVEPMIARLGGFGAAAATDVGSGNGGGNGGGNGKRAASSAGTGEGGGTKQRTAATERLEMGAAVLRLAESAERLRNEVLALFDCDVPRVVDQALAACRADLRRLGGVEVIVVAERDPVSGAGPATIWPDELLQILRDLVRNAVEAMTAAPEPRLEVRITWALRHVSVRVIDSGRGIPGDRVERVFEESGKGAEGGTGLWNAREALSRFGGRIAVEESQLGEGTCMLVELRRRRTDLLSPVLIGVGGCGASGSGRAVRQAS